MENVNAGLITDIWRGFIGIFKNVIVRVFNYDESQLNDIKSGFDDNGNMFQIYPDTHEDYVIKITYFPILTEDEAVSAPKSKEAAGNDFNLNEYKKFINQRTKDKMSKWDFLLESIYNTTVKKSEKIENCTLGAMFKEGGELVKFKNKLRYSTEERNPRDSKAAAKDAKQAASKTNSNASSSRRLIVSLSKVDAGEYIDINLNDIYANYNILDASQDLDNVINDDTFINEIPDDGPILYEIVTDDNCYNIDVCDEKIDSIQKYNDMLKLSLEYYSNINQFIWCSNAKVRDTAFAMVYPINEVIQKIGKYIYDLTLLSPAINYSDMQAVDIANTPSSEKVKKFAEVTSEYVNSMKCYYNYIDDNLVYDISTSVENIVAIASTMK